MEERATKEGMAMEVVHVLVDIQVLIVNVLKEPMLPIALLMIALQECMDQTAKVFVIA